MAENKLLTESLEALLSGDINSAKRKFDNYYSKVTQQAYKLVESEDFDDFDGDAEDIVSNVVDTETDEETRFDDILAAISELEGKYPSDMTDELVARFDELKNRVDDLRLCEEEDSDDLTNDALITLEDLKGDFEVVDGMSDEVIDLFNEIGEKLSGDDAEDDVEASADADFAPEGDLEDEKELNEAFEEKKNVKLSEEGEPELEMSEDEEVAKEPAGEGEDDVEAKPAIDNDRSVEDLINDAEDNAADMTELLRTLKAEVADDEKLDESAEMKKVKTNAKSEEAGVVKNGMKMPRPAKIDTEAGMDGSKASTKGKSVNMNIGKMKAENEAEKMKPVQKPSNKGVAGKSVLG